MSAAGSSEEQFLCSICLEVFSEPVTTPCGHNFCKRCISQTWDTKVVCKCPLCNMSFSIRPELYVNTFISEMVSQFKLEAELRSKQVSKPGDVQCSVCSEPKLKAECAEALIQQLQQEMCELEKSSTEAQQLSLSTDPLHFLQRCPALPPAGLKDWSSVSFEPQTCEGSVVRALSELETSLSQEFNKVFTQLPKKNQLRRVQQFSVDVTLDTDTAQPNLVLSEDLKQVYCGDVRKDLPDSPHRFDYCACVLGKQSFSSGRFYFEVQVKGKTKWDLGVVQESINRKGQIIAFPDHGQWSIWLRNRDQYSACASPPVPLSLKRPPQKVGVFVDYGAGLVSFYDVDSADLIYSFTDCSFRGKILPLFCPCTNDGGTNSAPLIITDVQTDRL
uniref:E3 ubiquitin-protein ligase TRIM21-like n=1 Tax=Neogobius melanostomus TaxID=47308 RepID=A0A8C6UD60_9GOBI